MSEIKIRVAHERVFLPVKRLNQHEDDEEAMKRQKKALNSMKFLLPDILPSHHYN